MDIMLILEILLALTIVVAFFVLSGVGFGFFWLIIWVSCSTTLRRVIGIEFWILMISLVILSGQANAPIYIPLLDETIPGIPYWVHIMAVAFTSGLVVTIILIPSLIALRIKYGKDPIVFNIKV